MSTTRLLTSALEKANALASAPTAVAFSAATQLAPPPLDPSAHLCYLGERLSGCQKSPVARQPPPKSAGAQPHDDRSVQELDGPSAAFFRSLCRLGNVSPDRYRPAIMMRRRTACLRTLRVADLSEAQRSIERNPATLETALDSIMIGVTRFFRDRPVFESLAAALPALHARHGSIKALSIACSDGAELYSVAMLLAEAGLLSTSSLHGVDCRRSAIEAARCGTYCVDDIREVEKSRRDRFFESTTAAAKRGLKTAGVAVVPELREACRWSICDAFNLDSMAEPLPRADLIVCRNLAIYLRPEAASELWKSLVERLRPGGLLMVGKAERPVLAGAMGLRRVSPSLYQKQGQHA